MDQVSWKTSFESPQDVVVLVHCLSDRLPSVTLEGANELLESVPRQRMSFPSMQSTQSSGAVLEYRLGCLSFEIAQEMCIVGSRPNAKRKQNWDDLLHFSTNLLERSHPLNEATVLAISMVFGALSLWTLHPNDAAKTAASALSSTVLRKKSFLPLGKDVSKEILLRCLMHCSHSDAVDLQIITQFARAFRMTDKDDERLGAIAARAISHAIRHLDSNAMTEALSVESQKQAIAASLALACQVRPWSELSPKVLVEAALPYTFWHGAEQVCVSAYEYAKSNKARSRHGPGSYLEAKMTTELLIDVAMEEKSFGRADRLASSLYSYGGKSRLVEARFHHACNTIGRAARKRTFPLIERQVERVDKSIAGVYGTLADADIKHQALSREIRKFALDQLHELGEIEMCKRLSGIWGMVYTYDENAMLEALAVRRQRYLQFDEVLFDPIPELVSIPSQLRSQFDSFWMDGPYPKGPFGFDAEWEEESQGAELLQVSHPKQALLIDIPALSSTEDGVRALTETIGALFQSPHTVVVGFSCHHDLSRLRGTPVVGGTQHWLSGTQAVVVAQKLVVAHEPALKKQSNALGLSRVCQYYFGKPLDKAEQCSMWSARPLSVKQLSYAALDAWVCAAVYERLFPANCTDRNKTI